MNNAPRRVETTMLVNAYVSWAAAPDRGSTVDSSMVQFRLHVLREFFVRFSGVP